MDPRFFVPLAARGGIIVTPDGAAYFPAAARMTPEEYLDWLASLNVSLPPAPPRRYLSRAA